MTVYTPRTDTGFAVDGSLTTQDADVYRGFGALRFKATDSGGGEHTYQIMAAQREMFIKRVEIDAGIDFEVFTDGATFRVIVDDDPAMGTLHSPADNDAYTFVSASGLNVSTLNTAALAARDFSAFYGDSVTAGSVITDWGDLWVNRYSVAQQKGWRNFGLSGSKVQSGGGTGGIDRVALLTDLGPQPASVFILYGINDIEAGRTDTQFEGDYDTMLDSLISGMDPATVFWCMGITPLSGGDRATNRLAFNTKIAGLVTALDLETVRYVDTDGWFDPATQTVGSDGVHPNAAANTLMALALAEATAEAPAGVTRSVSIPRSILGCI